VNLTLAQLTALAATVGFPNPPLAAAIAMAESGGNPGAIGDLNISPGGSVGLWQINLAAHPSYTADQLTDPTANAQAAFAISSAGTNWRPWTTYMTGAYKKYYHPFPVPPIVAIVLLIGGTAAWYLRDTWLPALQPFATMLRKGIA
jgi:Lysozyme like domain